MSPFSGIGSGLRRLRDGLSKTRAVFRRLLATEDMAELEELLLAADVGVEVSQALVERARSAGDRRRAVLEEEITRMLTLPARPEPADRERPRVAMIVGVNGSGKTTTTGKLCHYLRQQDNRVVVAAADTYRDAAAEQLGIWAERAGVEIVSSARGQDAAAVAFDAITRATARGIDFVLVDTAGRLHTRRDLMDEVLKIRRVCGKVRSGAPDDIWLVLDATVGQNGLRQARAFHELLGVTGIVMAKLDGTAKGGVLLPVVHELGIPILFVGTGEGIGDLEPFDPAGYARALFEE